MSSHFEYEQEENILEKKWERTLCCDTERSQSQLRCGLRNPGLLLSYLTAIPPKGSTISKTMDGKHPGVLGRKGPYVYTSKSVTGTNIPKL